MLASTHILSGVLIWEMSPGPWWVRVPLAGIGGYVSHYVLDSVATYHDCWPDSWWDVGLVWVQMVCVGTVLGAMAYRVWRRRVKGNDIQAGSKETGKDRRRQVSRAELRVDHSKD